MAFRFNNYDNSIVIDGFEKGIADSPYLGLADMRNANIASVPGEAAVNFSTSKISAPAITTGTITAVNDTTDVITYTGATNLEDGMAVVFSGTVPTGISTGTPYWIRSLSAGTFKLSTKFTVDDFVDITSTTTGATFTSYNMAQPKYFTYNTLNAYYFLVDSSGQVWSNGQTTTSGYWTFLGNTAGNGSSHGNGIVFQQISNTGGYVFVFRDSAIDYLLVGGATWVYGWKPSDASTGNAAGYLNTGNGTNNPHFAFVAPDSRIYYTDGNWIGRWYQTDPNVNFVPTTLSTYTFDQTALLPKTDRANCLAYLGSNLLVGGKNNIVYPWDRFNTNFLQPILLPEYNVTNMVTVNTNTYIFVGNRGRIYFTNGGQAQLYKKIPDHISGTIEPYFTWGGATSVKNQLYFSALAVTNAGTAISQYGGVWGIDLDTKAIRLTNKLSYGSYAGYATAIIPNFGSNPAGTGLFIGWDTGSSVYGLDTTISTPYSNGETTIDSDLIPIGTYNKPRNATYIEYRLSRPLVANESIVIKTRLIFDTSDTGYSTTLTDSTAGNYSGTAAINFKNAQWVQFQAVLTSTSSSPSYVRLTQLRIAGITEGTT